MKSIFKLFLGVLLTSTGLSFAQLPNYEYSVGFAVTGYKGSSALADFPVLVRLASGNPQAFSYANCKTDGSDIYFIDSNGNQLAHEIDTWNTQGESCIWVKIPSMTKTTTFQMRYGGDTVANDPKLVWSNYSGVWHMNENAASQTDCTGNGLTATVNDGVTFSLAEGMVGQSLKKSGILRTVDFFAEGNDFTTSKSAYSFSGWYYWPEYDGKVNANPLQKGAWATADGWYLQHKNSNTPVQEKMILVTKTYASATFSVKNCSKFWNYVCGTYDGKSVKVFVNGVLAITYTKTFEQGSYPFIIGTASGYADETRVMRAATTADFAAADYAAQTGALLTAGRVKAYRAPDVVVDETTSLVNCRSATLKLQVLNCGYGATEAAISLAYGTAPNNLDGLVEVKSNAVTGDMLEAAMQNLEPGKTYYYEIHSVNNGNPPYTDSLSGTFSTCACRSPKSKLRC